MSFALAPPDKEIGHPLHGSLAVEGLSARDRLCAIMAGDLAFHQHSSSYSSHTMHAFAAKFPPQLPGVFIENLTDPGEIVLDPMAGSGTTILEAALRGRRGIGVDIDPLARLIGRVKTMSISAVDVARAGAEVVRQATAMANDPTMVGAVLDQFDADSRSFIDYWFAQATQGELTGLITAISNVEPTAVREYLLVVFSSVIITKSGGVSLAMDLAHTRPHKVERAPAKSAIKQFEVRLAKAMKGLVGMPEWQDPPTILEGDARNLPVPDSSVQLVVTSPPYANAIDYMRAHKFSLVWMGMPTKELSQLRSGYIGAERINVKLDQPLPSRAETLLSTLVEVDPKKARVLRQYLIEMRASITEMRRVLEPGRAAIIVVGASTMRGLEIPTPDMLGDMAEEAGFEVIGIVPRQLDRNRRMMPARFKNNGQSLIENRMHEEHVIALIKR